MYYYFPKEDLKNCPEGFNLLPVVRSKEDPTKFHTDLSLTPFSSYEKSIIRISDRNFIDTSKVLEVSSYLLLHCAKDWLAVSNTSKDLFQAGLLPELVNRGEEQSVYTYNFNSIRSGLTSGDKTMVVLGFIITPTNVIFVNRFDFPTMPQFLTNHKKFVSIPSTEFFTSARNSYNFDSLSDFILESIGDTLENSKSSDGEV